MHLDYLFRADATCEDCITFGTAMQGYLMSADSISEQTELLVAILCPQAQDQAECDAAIRKYWEGIGKCNKLLKSTSS